jgi:hypothetical protein
LIRFGAVLVRILPWLLAASIADAQTQVVIVVPHSNTDDYYPYEHRLRSELISEGYQPVSVEISNEVSAATLKQNATRLMSPAAISLTIRDQVIAGTVWIQGRQGSRDLLRPVPEYPLGPQAPSVIAVRAADVLHGGLLELGYIGTAPEPPAPAPTATPISQGSSNGSTPPSPPAPAASRSGAQTKLAASPKSSPISKSPPTPQSSALPDLPQTGPREGAASVPPQTDPSPRWQIRALFSLAQPYLRSPLALGASTTATAQAASTFRIGLSGTYLAPARGETTPYLGMASVTQTFVGPTVELHQSHSSRFDTYQFLDAGLHALFVTGEAPPPNRPHSTRAYTGYAQLGLGAALALEAHLSLTVQAGLLLPFKAADVKVTNTTVIEAAGPAAMLNAGLGLSL